eukprot:EG_transcript_18764
MTEGSNPATANAHQKGVVAVAPSGALQAHHHNPLHIGFRDGVRALFSQLRSSRRHQAQQHVQHAAANLGRPQTAPVPAASHPDVTRKAPAPEQRTADPTPKLQLPADPTPCELVSPEAALGQLSEKTLLDARALCLAKQSALKEQIRVAQASLQALQESDKPDAAAVARLEQELQQREADLKRWGCRVRVADAELHRRGLLAPSTARDAVGTKRLSQGDPQVAID